MTVYAGDRATTVALVATPLLTVRLFVPAPLTVSLEAA